MVTHKVYFLTFCAGQGGGHLIGFLEPRLHCHRALVSGPQKNVGVTVLYRRRN